MGSSWSMCVQEDGMCIDRVPNASDEPLSATPREPPVHSPCQNGACACTMCRKESPSRNVARRETDESPLVTYPVYPATPPVPWWRSLPLPLPWLGLGALVFVVVGIAACIGYRATVSSGNSQKGASDGTGTEDIDGDRPNFIGGKGRPGAATSEIRQNLLASVKSFEDKVGKSPMGTNSLPMLFDTQHMSKSNHTEADFWKGMHLLQAADTCLYNFPLLCKALLADACNCETSSVELIQHGGKSKIKGVCAAGNRIASHHADHYSSTHASVDAHLRRLPGGTTSDFAQVIVTGGPGSARDLHLKGVEVDINARFYPAPEIDFVFDWETLVLHVTGDNTVQLDFRIEAKQKVDMAETTLFHLPGQPVIHQKCVATVCLGIFFQAAVKLEVSSGGPGHISADIYAEYSFKTTAKASAQTGLLSVTHADAPQLRHWENTTSADSTSHMKVSVSVVPILTVMMMPVIPQSLAPYIDVSFMPGLKTEASIAKDKAVMSSMNIHLSSKSQAFGIPDDLSIQSAAVTKGIADAAASAGKIAADEVHKMATDCKINLEPQVVRAIESVANSSIQNLKMTVFHDINLTTPQTQHKDAFVPACWNVQKRCSAAGDGCIIDKTMLCPVSNKPKPNATAVEGFHMWPHGSVGFTMTSDCNYSALSKVPDLLAKVQKNMVFAIAALVGSSVTPDDVSMEWATQTPKQGVYQATITPPHFKDPSAVQLALAFRKQEEMASAIAGSMNEVSGIDKVCNTPVKISRIGVPMLKVCHDARCPKGNSSVMRSHGAHSVCRRNSGDGSSDGHKTANRTWGGSIESCKASCLEDEHCTGVEYGHGNPRRCERWTRPIHFCSMFPVPGSTEDGDVLYECFTKCRSGHPVASNATDI